MIIEQLFEILEKDTKIIICETVEGEESGFIVSDLLFEGNVSSIPDNLLNKYVLLISAEYTGFHVFVMDYEKIRYFEHDFVKNDVLSMLLKHKLINQL